MRFRVWLHVVALGCLVGTMSVLAAESSLIVAVKKQDVQSVRTLLKQQGNVNATEADGFTALHWAAQRNDMQLVELLIGAGANAKASTRYNITPLYLAAVNGNAAVIERLLKAGADPNGVSQEGQTMLMTAALSGKADAVRLLLTHGAKIDTKEPYRGQTALMWAAAEGNTAAVDVLLEAGADLTLKSNGGFTPLLFAARNAHIETTVALLKRDANVNDIATDGSSALSIAAVNAYFELASVLLEYGANPNLPDPRGSPLHTVAWLRKPGADGAAGVGNTPVGTPQQTGKVTAIQLARKLLEHGANPNTRVEWNEPRFGKEGGTARNPPNIRLGRHLLSYRGATPFYVAAKNGDIELMRLLVEFKADPTITTLTGVTPLMVAAGLDTWEGETPGPFTGVPEAERLEAVKFAVSLGADVNARANFLGVGDPRWNGSTPLIGAIMSNQPSIVQYLVDQGADVRTKTTLGWTPLNVADGVFCCNAKKEFPAAAAIIRKAMGGK